MSAYYIPALNSFIAEQFKDDGTYPDWFSDAVLLTAAEEVTYWGTTAPAGKTLGNVNGRPGWVDVPALSPAELVAVAATKKQQLLETAQSTISLWQSELLLGTISDADKASLTKWIAYIKAVQAIDTTKLPVTWPVQPA